MIDRAPVVILSAVEGTVDEAVSRRLIEHVDATPGTVYGKNGKAQLRRVIDGYNMAARRSPWLVIVDLNSDAECAPPMSRQWLHKPAPRMCFRIAAREIEAWLLADREALAGFLKLPRSRLPANPEGVANPKRLVVDLARRSPKHAVREDMVPRRGSGREVGPAYASRLIEFVQRSWRPAVAAQHANSLSRCIECLRDLARGGASQRPSVGSD